MGRETVEEGSPDVMVATDSFDTLRTLVDKQKCLYSDKRFRRRVFQQYSTVQYSTVQYSTVQV